MKSGSRAILVRAAGEATQDRARQARHEKAQAMRRKLDAMLLARQAQLSSGPFNPPRWRK